MDGGRERVGKPVVQHAFDGWKLKGRAVRTIVRGKTVWKLER